MQAGKHETRKRKLLFPEHCADEELALLTNRILALESVTGLKMEGRQMEVEYEFPGCSYMDIWTEVEASSLVKHFSFFPCLLQEMRANAEFNERQHLENRKDWFRYTRDIYVHHHLARQQVASHKHLWRRHQKS